VTAVRPLDGVRVLDLTRLLPGAYATLLLADLGAEVIKIEDPRGGDGMRSLPTAGSRNYFDLLNRNKRSVTLDLRSPESAAVVDALCAKADVSIDSFRPSTAKRLGVDVATLHGRHPHLVAASISGFGQSGPDADRAAHDINYQALAGLLLPAGARSPQMPGPLVGDIGAATHAALRIVAALLLRARTGTGSIVDVSIQGAAMAWAMFPTTGELANACYTFYETADGRWLALGALEPKFWKGFCERIGRPDLVALQHARGDERTWVDSEVRRVMLGLTRDEWLARFADADVCLSAIYSAEEAGADPHLPGPPQADVAGRRRADSTAIPAPALGADTDAVLEAAGFGEAERARLRASGVL
jgi:alpha-methylacyl-CoA racemase